MRTALIALAVAMVTSSGGTTAASAKDADHEIHEGFVPTIWVDPDGCEHWVMDDGWRGYMDARIDRNGLPVCRRGRVCAAFPGDVLFASGSAEVSSDGRRRLAAFFRKGGAAAYSIAGHTDSAGSDTANMALSEARAEAVAAIARANGAKVRQAIGYGERDPVASNDTPAGMAKNRRVEVRCEP